jgi:hypothetical protein
VGRGKVWEITLDGRPMERFSRLEEAVEAVDFELDRMGPAARHSALPDARWRTGGAGEGLRLATWRRFHPRG